MSDVTEFPHLDHDQITEVVRLDLSRRLKRFLDRMDVFMDDDPRDFTPGQVANYLAAVKIWGALYQVQLRPPDKSGMLSVEKVEQLLAAAREEAAREAVEAERARLAAEARMALESAGAGVREALQRERDRRAREGQVS